MAKINAQRAAQKTIETIAKGKLVNHGKILLDVGYSVGISKQPSRVTRTRAYQAALAMEKRPIIEGLQKEINRIKDAMSRKNLDHEEYRVLAGSLDLLVKNFQLLNGGATDRHILVLPSEVIERNNLLSNGSTEPQK